MRPVMRRDISGHARPKSAGTVGTSCSARMRIVKPSRDPIEIGTPAALRRKRDNHDPFGSCVVWFDDEASFL